MRSQEVWEEGGVAGRNKKEVGGGQRKRMQNEEGGHLNLHPPNNKPYQTRVGGGGRGGKRSQSPKVQQSQGQRVIRSKHPKDPRSQGPKDQHISESHSNSSLTLKKVHLVPFSGHLDKTSEARLSQEIPRVLQNKLRALSLLKNSTICISSLCERPDKSFIMIINNSFN